MGINYAMYAYLCRKVGSLSLLATTRACTWICTIYRVPVYHVPSQHGRDRLIIRAFGFIVHGRATLRRGRDYGSSTAS